MHLLFLLQDVAEQGAHEAAGGSTLLSPNTGLMVWTVLLFVVLWFILSKFAFPKITEAVRAREQALQDAIDAAKRDRENAEVLLKEQRTGIANARDEAQRIIAEGRTVAEQMRTKLLEDTHAEQQGLLERARQEIAAERDRAIADLRREAVDLAIAGASKVIEKNLDESSNRKIVESFLASIPVKPATPGGR